MKDLHSFGWYAGKIKPDLPNEAFDPVPARLWGGLAYLLVTIAGLLTIGLLSINPIFYLGISIILGCSFAALGFLGHEILHGTVVRKPWLRDFLGAIAFWPLTTGPRLWRKWHNLTHHVHTQHEEHDPDAWPTFEKLAKSRFLRWIYRLPLGIRAFFSFCSLSIQFSAHSMKMFTVYLKEFNPKKRPAVLIEAILPWMTWIGLLVWVGPFKWFFMFLLPLLIANLIVMGYISTNHRLNPTTEVNDPLANSLTVTVPKWVDFLHFNFSYHTEHHLFPGVSSKYYPLVKEQIKKRWPERYHEMPMGSALVALWKTPRLYYQQSELIDPSKGTLFGSLGNGLDPKNIQSKGLDTLDTLKAFQERKAK
ncbi:fatty acid desaturase family protein [Halalkalibacter nanhaiisediminis]|uniref:Fatty acid desaturase n=1 Tax=Halalkalibacter nanhaiisediminis TaxID=688079 RepID=A0A562QR03_9BACI|nr:acyl-CoA desaturase [Halalkalibacter nanhaiisediminis]TWI59182.1 fatty acid desaturase [Halalkalibacter nanhaiisediminis]